MAQMLPPIIGSDVPDSERTVYSALSKMPNTHDWTIFHSVGLSSIYTGHFGEIDYVIIVPEKGIVCIEVKGGAISQKDGIWTSRDRHGRVHVLDPPPYRQVQNAMFKLRRAIEGRFGKNSIECQVPLGWMVAFPDCSAPPVSPELVRADILDCGDLRGQISTRIENCPTLKQAREKLDTKIIPKHILQRIKNFIRPDFDRVLAPGATLFAVEDALRSLTEEQYAFLDSVNYNSRCIVIGPAGSGKTTLAIEHARRMAQAGKSVLLICFNRLLGDWLHKIAKDISSNIVAGSFHKILSDRINKSSLSAEFKSASGHKDIFNEIFPLYGLQAIEEIKEKFDVVLVDEAQDFDPGLISSFIEVWSGVNPESFVVVFGDFSRQAIFEKSRDAFPKLKSLLGNVAIISLTRNCRNTKRIALQTSYLSGFDGYRNLELQPDGDAVDVRFYISKADEVVELCNIITELKSEGVQADQIVILGKVRLENWKELSEVDMPWPVVDAGEANRSSITYSTIYAFKGLEAPVIILTSTGALGEDDEPLLYVGMSRARVRLYMLIDEQYRSIYDQKIAKGISRALLS